MSDLTSEFIKRVCLLEEQTGMYPDRLLVSEGVKRATARNWLRIGEECSDSRDASTPHQHLCVELVEGLDEAAATVERRWWAEYDQAIQKADETGKQAGALAMITRLERRFPDRYKRVQAERTGPAQTIEDAVYEMEREREREARDANR